VQKTKEVSKYLAQVSIGSFLETRTSRTRTQLYVAKHFHKRSVVDGTGEVHTQLINGRLHKHTVMDIIQDCIPQYLYL